ncbi:MAG: hypothetical protein K2I34_04880, partial [Paramuribaculum sp.]|nr:hypothetical protein [Paramuribaculum sp.]
YRYDGHQSVHLCGILTTVATIGKPAMHGNGPHINTKVQMPPDSTKSSAPYLHKLFENVATNTANYIGKNYVTLPKNCEKKRHGTDMRNRWSAAAL